MIGAADQAEGAPHPRATLQLHGQQPAERELVQALRGGRMAHAWLLHGPRGVGKATLAYRLARVLLRAGGGLPDTLECPGDDPAARRVAADSDPRLRTLRRKVDSKTKRLSAVIRIDDVRSLGEVFHVTALAGGWRVAIVDSAEEMSDPAANALLKILEEPPRRALLLLVSHAPHRLLPTLRSRCRHLALRPLDDGDFRKALKSAMPGMAEVDLSTLARTCGGSVGEAVRLHAARGTAVVRRTEDLLDGLPRLPRVRLGELVDELSVRDAAELRGVAMSAAERKLARLALAAAGAENSGGFAEALRPLASRPAQAAIWAEAATQMRGTAARAALVHIDPSATLLKIFAGVEAAARRAAETA